MKVVSLCSGVGITDMCFTQKGNQILVATDKAPDSTEIYKYNHQYADEHMNPTVILGDVVNKEIQDDIIRSAKAKIPEDDLDLLMTFLPPSKSLKEMLGAINHIAKSLNTKMIFIDALCRKQYSASNLSTDIIQELNLHEEFYCLTAFHNLNAYGVPNGSKRQIYILMNKQYFNEEKINESESILQKIPQLATPSLRELFFPIQLAEKQEIPLPLHINPIELENTEHKEDLLNRIKQLRPEENLFKKGINKTIDNRCEYSCYGRRASYDKPLSQTISAKASLGFQWMIHPEFPRGFTPMEIAFLSTLHLIPFEIAPRIKGETNARTVMHRIAGGTAPGYLLHLIDNVLVPMHNLISCPIDMNPLTLKNPTKYASFIVDGRQYFSGSINKISSGYSSKAVTDIFYRKDDAEKNELKDELHKYRTYLYSVVQDAIKKQQSNDEYFQKLILFLTKINAGKATRTMSKDVFTAKVQSHYRVIQILIETIELGSRLPLSSLPLCREAIDSIINKPIMSVAQIVNHLGVQNLTNLKRLFINARQNASQPAACVQLLDYEQWKASNQNCNTGFRFFNSGNSEKVENKWQSENLPIRSLGKRSEQLKTAEDLNAKHSKQSDTDATSTPLHALQSNGFFQQKDTAEDSLNNFVVNNLYQYNAEDINRLLLVRLGSDYPNVHVLAAALMDNDISGNRIADVMRLFINDSEASTNAAQILLIPVAIGEHWVGVRLDIQQGIAVKATYYNSLRGSYDIRLMEDIHQELRVERLCSTDFMINFSVHELQQPDGTSCGPFLVENMVRDIKNRGWKPPQSNQARQELMENIRQFHANILKEKSIAYFNQFRLQQQIEEPLPSVSHQLQTHGKQ